MGKCSRCGVEGPEHYTIEDCVKAVELEAWMTRRDTARLENETAKIKNWEVKLGISEME